MKLIFNYLLVWLLVMSLRGMVLGVEINEVIANGEVGVYKLENAVILSPVQVTIKGDMAKIFDRFYINYIQVRKDMPTRIYFTIEDVMPPGLFVHIPSNPKPEDVCGSENIQELRARLGHSDGNSNGISVWSFFQASSTSINIVQIRASYIKNGHITGIAVYEARGRLSLAST